MKMYSTTFINRCFKDGEECSKKDKLKVNPKQVFAVMQFKDKNNVKDAIADAAVESDLLFHRADMKQSNIMLYCKICQDIQNSRFIIGDISELNPNVLLEIGLAAAIGRTILLIKAHQSKAPSDLLGMETLNYDPNDIKKLKDRLRDWLKRAKSEQYLFDDYLSGHLLRAEQMEINLDNFNAKGDTNTKYTITSQKIGLGDTDENICFAMPYHDSDSVDVSENYFNLDVKAADNESLNVQKIIFTKRLKRFSVILPQLGFEERCIFTATLKEKQLFHQDEPSDYYDVNISHPTELLRISIKFNPKWKIKKLRACYGESGQKVRSEQRVLKIANNQIIAEFVRPKVGLTYFIRWDWVV